MAADPAPSLPRARSRIDYRMRRRALLAQTASGSASFDAGTEAHPDLLRAAEYLGVDAADDCPVCDEPLVHVTYVFDGDRRRHPGGRALPPGKLAQELDRWGRLELFLVEVCTTCRWHFLLEQSEYEAPMLGADDGQPRA